MKKSIRVLFIEDSSGDTELVLSELRQGGFEPDYCRVQTAESFKTALDEQNWQIILCALSMPEFDGLTALNMANEKGLDIPFILISEMTEENIAVKALRLGACDYLTKNTLQRLVPRIERELEKAEIREKQKLFERTLKKSEQRLRKVQQIAKLGNWEVDYVNKEIDWSEELNNVLFGETKIKFDGKYQSFLNLIHPEDRDEFDRKYRYCKDNNLFFEFAFRLIPNTDQVKYFHAQCEHIYNDNGEIMRSVGILQDITRNVMSKIKIRQSLNEKKVLLAEIHHRVKNNMAIISSLLQLGLTDHENEKTKNLILGSVLRIKTMTLIHDKLYSYSDFAKISISTFVFELISIIESHFESKKNINLKTNTDEAKLNINQAIPLALILNELVTNAYKHAFPQTEWGEIEINIFVESNELFLNVNDNGVGFPPDFDAEKSQSLGLTMVNLLTEQLGGVLVVEQKEGTRFSLQFEIKDEVKGASGNIFPTMESTIALSD